MSGRSDMTPWPGALRVPYRAFRNYVRDDGPQWAAALAFYGILSFIPLVVVASAGLSLFVTPEWAAEQASGTVESLLPFGAPDFQQAIEGAVEMRARASVASLLLLLWTGSRVFAVLTHAINIAFAVQSTYSLTKRRAVQLSMAVTLGALFVLALLSRTLLRLALAPLDETTVFEQLALWVLPSTLLFISFYITYRYVPRCTVSNGSALAGAVVAFLLFAGARPVFLAVLSRMGDYNAVYGSLAILILLLIWVCFVAQVVLLGAQVTSYVQGVFVEGHTPEEMQERHIRSDPFHKPPSETLETLANGVKHGVDGVRNDIEERIRD
jgi:membrane protein